MFNRTISNRNTKSAKRFAKKLLSLCLALIACFGACQFGSMKADAAYYISHPTLKEVYITPKDHRGFAIDITGGSTSRGAFAQLYTRSKGNAAQIFVLERIPGEDWYIIRHKASGLCLNIQSGDSRNDARIWLWEYDGTDSCLFRFAKTGTNTYIIQNKLSSQRVIDLDNNIGRNSSIVHLWDFHSGSSAQWTLVDASGDSAKTTTVITPQQTTTHKAYVNTSSSNLVLRKSASTSSAKLASMPKYSSVTVLDNKKVYGGSFYRVTYNGTTGYCSKSYIAFGDAPTTKLTVVTPNVSITTNSSSILFPLKGSITRSSSVKTNGQYCDYRTGGSVGVYAPTSGTVTFYQTYAYRGGTNKLVSYGNWVEFRSSDGKYVIKMAHLNSFNTAYVRSSSLIPSSNSERLSASSVNCTTKMVGSATVSQGALLGYSGKTGNASGHHLHLEVKKNGSAVNPVNVFTQW